MMTNLTISRRRFSELIGVGAAYAALESLPLVNSAYAAKPSATIDSVVRLSSNENPYGPSAAALKAMTDGFSQIGRASCRERV